MPHFNSLTPAEAERLALLLEELGAAQHAIGKILRHGYESRHPDGGPTNRQELDREIGSVFAALHLLCKAADIDSAAVYAAKTLKLKALPQYLHHNIVETP
jgi:hypothetical protein